MTEHQRRCMLVGYARRLEVVYNQVFADIELTERQKWIQEDQGYIRTMIEDDVHESQALRIVMESRLTLAKEI